MSRAYDMCVEITGVKPERRERVIAACCEEWSFATGDFDDGSILGPAGRGLTASAGGRLCGGETEEEFADRIATAVWRANGGYCQVTIHATYLEVIPCESHVRDEDDFVGWQTNECP